MQALRTRRFGQESLFFEEIDSTNRWLLANEELFRLSGATVVADHQTAGRGRYGRQWHDTQGKSLLFSVLLRPESKASPLGLLSLMAGAAVAHAIGRIDSHFSEKLRLKWPNDVLIDGRKVAGILVESISAGTRSCAVIGVGVNLRQSEDELPKATRWPASSLQMLSANPVSREDLAAEILNDLEAAYDLFQEGRTVELIDPWASLSLPLGTELAAESGGSVIKGIYAGVGTEGQLLLKGTDGTLHGIHSGEILWKDTCDE